MGINRNIDLEPLQHRLCQSYQKDDVCVYWKKKANEEDFCLVVEIMNAKGKRFLWFTYDRYFQWMVVSCKRKKWEYRHRRKMKRIAHEVLDYLYMESQLAEYLRIHTEKILLWKGQTLKKVYLRTVAEEKVQESGDVQIKERRDS